LVLGLVLSVCFYSYSDAQTETTGNLVTNTRSAWEGCSTATSGAFWGGYSGGPCPGIDGSGQIIFSYGQYTLTQNINLPLVLGNSPIQIEGYNYSWWVKNSNINGQQPGNFDPVALINVSLYNRDGSVAESDTYNYGYHLPQWTNFSGSRTYNSQYSLTQVDRLSLSITSRDSGFWAGYYGPEFSNFSLSVRYSVDVCSIDPLSNTSCPGYQQAWEQYQYDLACSANPLYDLGCPGFQQELESQVCSVLGPLANLFCPGYAEALAFQQACSANPLYDPSCNGYGAAIAAKLQKEEVKEEPVVIETARQNTIEDTTKAETTVDVGGVELSTTGELSVPDGKPEVLKEVSIKEEEKEKEVKEVDRNLLMSIVREATDTTAAMRVVNQSIEQSMSEDANPDFSGTSEALLSISSVATQSFDVAMRDEKKEEQLFDSSVAEEEKKETVRENQQTFAEKDIEKESDEKLTILNVDSNNLVDLSNQVKVEIKEEAKEEKATVKKDAQENEAATGVNLADLTKNQLDITTYTNQALKDTQFYKSEEIYKNQTVTDNRRAQRILNSASDRLYNELIKQQHKE
jgi:hypothetical protein